MHNVWCRSAKLLRKSKFSSRSEFGSGSWFHFRFQYQTYILYIEDTHQILFGSANSSESYCVHMKSPRTYVHPDIQTDRQTEIFFGLFCLLRHKNHKHLSKGENFFFFHSCDYNTVTFYILHMWWESKEDANPLRLSIVLSHHMHRNWIGKSEAGRHWLKIRA